MKLRAVLFTLFFLALAAPRFAVAAADIDRMEASTVRIVAINAAGDADSGSGFVIGDGSYVVTNHHVINGAQRVWVVAKQLKLSVVGYLIDSPERDITILQLEKNSGRPGVTLATQATVKKTASVLAAGFPGASDEQREDWDNFVEVKFTQGIISAFETGSKGEALYQISAALNPGNSGGPLFDSCGRVIGINSQKSLNQVIVVGPDGKPRLDRAPRGEGIGWAIESDELILLLQRSPLHVPVETGACGVTSETTGSGGSALSGGGIGGSTGASTPAPAAGLIVVLIGVLVVVAGGLIVFILNRKKPETSTPSPGVLQANPGQPLPYPQGPPMQPGQPALPGRAPHLRAVSGRLAGLDVPLTTERLTLGRDGGVSQIVFPAEDTLISKRHCTIYFDPQRSQTILEDCGSTNGTFLESGERLLPNVPRVLAPRTRFYLGDRNHLFSLEG